MSSYGKTAGNLKFPTANVLFKVLSAAFGHTQQAVPITRNRRLFVWNVYFQFFVVKMMRKFRTIRCVEEFHRLLLGVIDISAENITDVTVDLMRFFLSVFS